MDKEVVDFDDFLETVFTLYRASPSKLYFQREEHRARLWRFELMVGYTGNRPGSFLQNDRSLDEQRSVDEIGEFDPVISNADLPRYKDFTLVQYPAKGGGRYGDWVLELEINHIKGGYVTGEKP
jgi:hypothetical protein